MKKDIINLNYQFVINFGQSIHTTGIGVDDRIGIGKINTVLSDNRNSNK